MINEIRRTIIRKLTKSWKISLLAIRGELIYIVPLTIPDLKIFNLELSILGNKSSVYIGQQFAKNFEVAI